MKLQEFDPRIISITDIRRNIGALQKVLKHRDEAFVMRNQSLVFVAVSPEKYQSLGKNDRRTRQIAKAVKAIDKIREEVKKYHQKHPPTVSAAEYVSIMREERKKKWMKK